MSNENIVHIEAIEGLLSEANKHLEQIRTNYTKQDVAKVQAIDEIHSFQAGALYNLRILCEGD